MNNEPKTTQQRIESLSKELETNNQLLIDFAAGMPTVIAEIPDGEAFELVVHTVKDWRCVFRSHPEIVRLFDYLGVMLERDLTRRMLSVNVQVGLLEQMGELSGPGENKGA